MQRAIRGFLERKDIAGFLAVLIVLSAISFTLESLDNPSDTFIKVLGYLEIFSVIVFTAEYILRVYSAEDRLKYIFGFYGIIDLLAIIPFYLSLAFDLRSLRLLRLFRLLRLLKLARYNSALFRIREALASSKEELVISVIALFFVVYLAAYGIFQLEHAAQPDKFRSFEDALWWAVATVTTVGYGDVYPITTGGRLLTFLILIVSLGLVAVPTGIFATALISVRDKNEPVEGNGNH